MMVASFRTSPPTARLRAGALCKESAHSASGLSSKQTDGNTAETEDRPHRGDGAEAGDVSVDRHRVVRADTSPPPQYGVNGECLSRNRRGARSLHPIRFFDRSSRALVLSKSVHGPCRNSRHCVEKPAKWRARVVRLS